MFSNTVNINSSSAGGFAYIIARNQGTGDGTDMRLELRAGGSRTFLDCQQVSASQAKYSTHVTDGYGGNGFTFQNMLNDVGVKTINHFVPTTISFGASGAESLLLSLQNISAVVGASQSLVFQNHATNGHCKISKLLYASNTNQLKFSTCGIANATYSDNLILQNVGDVLTNIFSGAITCNNSITSVGLTTSSGLTVSSGTISMTTSATATYLSGNNATQFEYAIFNKSGATNSYTVMSLYNTTHTLNYRCTLAHQYVSATSQRTSFWCQLTTIPYESFGWTNTSNIFSFFMNGNTAITGTLSATTGTFTGLISGSNGLTVSSGSTSLQATTIATTLNVNGYATLTSGGISTAPTADANITNKLYVDNLIKLLTPKINSVSYDCGNPKFAIQALTANYYEYNITISSGTYKTTNFIYPNSIYYMKQQIKSTGGSPSIKNYYAFSFINNSLVSTLESLYFGFMGDFGALSGYTTNWTANPNYYVNGVNNSTNQQFIYQASYNNTTGYIRTQNVSNIINVNTFIQPNAELICVLSLTTGASMAIRLDIINASTNAVIFSNFLNNGQGAVYTELTNATCLIPCLTMDTTSGLNKLRIYHTLNATMLANLDTANSGYDYTNGLNLFRN
jgi:hypothetical protein